MRTFILKVKGVLSEVGKLTISEKLTQQKFQEILINTYLKGQETKNIKVIEIIEEIKQQVLAVKK